MTPRVVLVYWVMHKLTHINNDAPDRARRLFWTSASV